MLRQSAINAVMALGQLVVIITAGIDLSIGSIMGLTIVLLALMMRGGTPSFLACVLAATMPACAQMPPPDAKAAGRIVESIIRISTTRGANRTTSL